MPDAVLYEVVISVDPEIRDAYLDWLRPHIEQMLTFDGFLSAEMYVNSEDDNEITCHYRVRDMTAMNAYLSGPAQEMRADGIKRFGDKISTRRRILMHNPI
jgi:quinol monooxygenase YgiN